MPWLVLRVAGREYALAVGNVREVLRMVALTPMPGACPWLAGLVNLRGQGVPVLDLRRRLGLPAVPASLDAVIVVVDVGDRPMGLLAEEVVEVLDLPARQLRATDPLAGSEHLFQAVAEAGERLILVLAPDRLGISLREAEVPESDHVAVEAVAEQG